LLKNDVVIGGFVMNKKLSYITFSVALDMLVLFISGCATDRIDFVDSGVLSLEKRTTGKVYMKKKSGYRLYMWFMILSGATLAITLTITSLKIIQEGKRFHRLILEENKTFLINTLRFGHGIMAHMGAENYESLIDLALKSQFIRYLAILDQKGGFIAQGSIPGESVSLEEIDPARLKDAGIVRETEGVLLISYKAREIVSDEEHKSHHATFRGHRPSLPKPGWFLVALDTTGFKRHNRDMLIQAVGVGLAFLLFGILVIVFFGIVGRYELAHLSIERLNKIKRVLGNFVPETAKDIIEKDPEKALLDKYIRDATVLFLDIEGFTTLLQKYSQVRINRVIEFYFSNFFDLIHKKGGDINETAGDGMMAIFLDSGPTQHAQNAVQAALEIQDRCLKISKTGDSEPFTASGSITILAARLSDYARGGQILISEETARRIGQSFPLTTLGKVPLKNLENSGEVYQLVGP